jgi:2-haloacid dehalogenase
VTTAQQVRSYKPAPAHFTRTIESLGVGPDVLLHVAQSLYHDIAPAKDLGLATVWVNRRAGRKGSGATPPAEARPDIEVPDLTSLVDLVEAGGGAG